MHAKSAGAIILLLVMFNALLLYKLNSRPTPYQRFLPISEQAGAALDTKTGMACRTFRISTLPLDVRDPFCMASDTQIKTGLSPLGCKDAKMMWNLNQIAQGDTPQLCKYLIDLK